MKKRFLLKRIMIGVVLLIAFIVVSCEKENDSNSKQPELQGELTGNSICKNELKATSTVKYISDTLSCVEYVFDEINNKLILKHINAGFNCCPDSLYVQTSLNGDTIIVQEYEKSALCRCNCLYDLDIELNGVEAKIYMVKFIEPYALDQQEILFELDLANNYEGSFCVTRKQYPWGVNDSE
ncbi:MAG: hypothetical protein ABFS35_18695 [Bacteroidota bacterium]